MKAMENMKPRGNQESNGERIYEKRNEVRIIDIDSDSVVTIDLYLMKAHNLLSGSAYAWL